jgi:transcriptional regulator with XRE-family HTH domain
MSEVGRSRTGDHCRDQRTDVAARFGENLRRIRLIERLSQDEMAQRASLHRTEIGLLESGKRVCRIDTLIRLAGAVAVPPEEFIEGIIWVPRPETKGAFSFYSRPFSQRRT